MKKKKLKKIKEKKVDEVFSKWIRCRDGRCLKCGTQNNLQCAHVFSRTARSVRWFENNAITLCYKCHMFWAHKNPIEFTEFIKSHLGTRKFNELKKKYVTLKSYSQQELLSLKEKYTIKE